MVRCLKSPISGDHLTGNVVNGPKHCFNLNDSTFTIFIDHVEDNLTVILTVFVNTLTADDKYSLLSKNNLMQANQMHLSQKQKTFPEFLCRFSDSTPNFEHFQKRMKFIADVIPNLRTYKQVVR